MTAPEPTRPRVAMPAATKFAIVALLVAAALLIVHWGTLVAGGQKALVYLVPSGLIDVGLQLVAAFLVWRGFASAPIVVTVVAALGVFGLTFNLDLVVIFVITAAQIAAAIAVWLPSARRYGSLRRGGASAAPVGKAQ